MPEQFTLEEGKTYEYIVHGSVLILLGILLFSVHWIFTLIVALSLSIT